MSKDIIDQIGCALTAGSKKKPVGAPKMRNGYGFRLNESRDWVGASDDHWDIVVLEASKSAQWAGVRKIDGSKVNVWSLRGFYYAQVA